MRKQTQSCKVICPSSSGLSMAEPDLNLVCLTPEHVFFLASCSLKSLPRESSFWEPRASGREPGIPIPYILFHQPLPHHQEVGISTASPCWASMFRCERRVGWVDS